MGEPTVTYATIREAIDPGCIVEFHIECRFSDGQKFAAVVVDGNHEKLAHRICEFLNTPETQTP